MTKTILLVLLLSLALTGTALGKDAVEFRLSIYERDTLTQKNVPVWEDTANFVEAVPASGFIGPFSAEIELLSADSAKANFNVQLVTLGPVANTYSKSFTVEYGLPATISGIAGKATSQYTFTVTPTKKTSVDTSLCPYDHRNDSTFTFTPAAYMDIYYVPNSLGDFYWEDVKDLMDVYYRQLLAMAHLTIPGKTLVYLCPCPLYSIIWDKRFGMSIDPTRNTAYAILNKDINTADPFIVQQTQILRNFGYSAPFLSEGFAGYFSFSIYDMKKIFKENRQIPLDRMMTTHDYYSVDAAIADRTVASFAKFLIDQYKLDKFMDAYTAADDLNLKMVLESTYGMSLSELQQEWKMFVDTSTIPSESFATQAGVAETMLNYKKMLEYSQGMLAAAKSRADSTSAYTLLKRAYFFNGDYYRATATEHLLLDADSTSVLDWMALGSYQMMNGYYDSALVSFKRAWVLDSTNEMVNFNLATYYLQTGQEDSARSILINNLSTEKGAQAQGESRVTLANLMMKSGNKAEEQKAARMYRETINNFDQALRMNSSVASLYMWIGISYLGLNDTENALNYLHTAEFLETRPFYVGMIDLWLGKTYLAMHDKKTADSYLGRVMSVASADYHQKEARKLLESN